MKMKYFIYIGIVLFLIFVDLLTKSLAFNNLPYGETTKCIPKLFKFIPVKNQGAAFGILDGQFVLFYIATFIGLVFFVYLMRYADFQKYPFFTVGLLMMIAGTIGNFIDRISLGYVRDFLTFDFFNFAIFNFADMCMTCGIVVIAIDLLFSNMGDLWK